LSGAAVLNALIMLLGSGMIVITSVPPRRGAACVDAAHPAPAAEAASRNERRPREGNTDRLAPSGEVAMVITPVEARPHAVYNTKCPV
jgi:hypothetical protein